MFESFMFTYLLSALNINNLIRIKAIENYIECIPSI